MVGIGEPGRRDRRGAADGPVLRRLDDRLGEHDRRGPGRALDRLLARRPARRPPPAPAEPVPGGARRRAAARRWSRSPPSPFFEVSVDALDEISAGAFVGSLIGVLAPDRGAGRPARRLLALGDPPGVAGRRARRRRSPAASTRSRPPVAARDDARGAGADPVRRDAAHVPALRPGARPGRRGRPRLAVRSPPAVGGRRRSRSRSGR